MKSLVTLQRYESSPVDTSGLLFVNGVFECHSLEDEYREKKVYGETRIPAGLYDLMLMESPKFTPRYKHKMILVTGVPTHTGILFHPGEDDRWTDGCILVGSAIGLRDVNGRRRLMDTPNKDGYFRFWEKVSRLIETTECQVQIVDEVAGLKQTMR